MKVPNTNLGFDLLIHLLPSSPFHLSLYYWTLQRTKKFVPFVKCLLIVIIATPITLWTVGGVTGSGIMSVVVAFGLPFMETFRAISKEGIPIHRMVMKCFTEGLRQNLKGASSIVCNFKDFSVHSFSSIIHELVKSRELEPIEFKFIPIPGCIFTAFLGVLVDVPIITMITVYKAPILLFKGWNRLMQDLIWRERPFLETVCVPFAVIWILSWPIAVLLAIVVGIMSSFCFGCYAAVVTYQWMNSCVICVATITSLVSMHFRRALHGEDYYMWLLLRLYLMSTPMNYYTCMKGPFFQARPRYRQQVGSSSSLPPLSSQLEQSDIIFHEQVGSTSSLLPDDSQLEQREIVCAEEPLIGPPSEIMKPLQAAMTWDSFIETCKDIGKDLLRDGAIGIDDLNAWKESRNKIINIGIPACAFLECFLNSIKNGSPGFLLRDNVEITSVNRPKGRIFDWLYEPMCIVKEQIRSLNLSESEELYFYKYCLYSGDKSRIKLWQNGGMPPQDEIRRAQLEGIGRRIQGFCSTLSRMPTSRRHFHELVKAMEQEANNLMSSHHGGGGVEEAS